MTIILCIIAAASIISLIAVSMLYLDATAENDRLRALLGDNSEAGA